MMSNISMVEANLPPGFRFHPRDEELVCDYLMKKIIHSNSDSLLFIEVDLNKCEPWDIPETACVGGKEWYFYSQRDRKYATGLRTNRATASGYWKATGKDRAVLRKGVLVGMRKTLVFYKGRAPKGTKADWVMHEFRLHAPPRFTPHKEDWVLCRVFCKNKEVVAKPRGGSCYDDTGSSSLPPLMDSYISFDQTQPNLLEDDDDDDEYEQVPCFSFFSPAQTNPISPPMNINQIDHYTNIIPTKNITATSSFGQLPINTTSTCRNLDNDFSSDKEAIEAFLNQITKMNSDPNHIHGSPSLGEASSESYLSEVGISNPWTNHRY